LRRLVITGIPSGDVKGMGASSYKLTLLSQ
jgi:hypothetical protein